MAFSSRTIFLFIRGIDQTGRATDIVSRNIRKIIDRQKELGAKTEREFSKMAKAQLSYLRGIQNLERLSYRMLFAGAAFISFGAMAAMGIYKLVEASSIGELYVEDFRRALEMLGISASESIVKNFGWAIQAIGDFFREVSKNKPLMELLTIIGVVGTGLILFMGIVNLVIGVVGTFIVNVAKLLLVLPSLAMKFAVLINMSWALLVPLLAVVAGFVAGWKVGEWMVKTFGAMPTVITGLIIALSALAAVILTIAMGISISTAGVAALAGLAAFGTAMAFVGYSALPKGGGGAGASGVTPYTPPASLSYGRQLGTNFVPFDQWAFLHAGEMVFNPQLPISGPSRKGGVGGMIEINITQYIDNISTEADEERLAQKTAEKMADRLTEMIG